MGLCRLPHEKMYFYSCLKKMVPPFAGVMQYTRWLVIKRNFRIPSITLEDNWKYMSHEYSFNHPSLQFNWYLHHFNTNSAKYIKIGETVALDESMALCKTRCSFTKKMKSKPINLGFRNFTTACSHSNICISLILDNKDRD